MASPQPSRCPNCFGAFTAPPCRQCGWQLGQDNPPPALALGRVLDGRYHIGRVLGQGGFGITYLAWDDNLHLRLAIKEYLPRDCATRASDQVSLSLYSGSAGEQFTAGLDRFIDEARALARFDQHPGIVTIKNFFRARGTGYCVMDYVEGITLRQYLQQRPDERVSVDDALRLLSPVMDALRVVHKEGLLHRDLAPDNIYVTRDGRVKLLDFGAARYAAGEQSRSLSIILKPGYAPEEQYRSRGRQGPWTDVYGLGATFYRLITGRIPPDALERLQEDTLIPPSMLGVTIPPPQETALLKALAVRAKRRFQTVTDFHQALTGAAPATHPPDHTSAAVSGINPAGLSPPLQPPDQGPAAVLASPASAAVGTSESVADDQRKSRGIQVSVIALSLLVGGIVLGHYSSATPTLILVGVILAVATLAFFLGKTVNTPASPSEAGSDLHPESARALAEQSPELSSPQEPTGERRTPDAGAPRPRNVELAWLVLRALAQVGDAKARRELDLLYRGSLGVTGNPIEAQGLLRTAAGLGDAVAQCWLGLMSLGTNDREALQWTRLAAEQGHPVAQYNLGMIYQDGLAGLVVKDPTEAARWFHRAAERGDAPAQHRLGWLYQEGIGVTQSDSQAVHWYTLAAEAGHPEAPYHLGWLFEKGRGVPRNETEALRWYRMGGERGDLEARSAAGRLEGRR